MKKHKGTLFGFGALASGTTAALTTLCCVAPIAAGTLGVGAAAVGAWLEPYRPYFLSLTLACLGFAFYRAYRPERCEQGKVCATPEGRRRQRLVLWLIAITALLLATSYYWISLYVYATL